MSDRPRVAVVHLGRAAAMGQVRRVEGWRLIFTAAGADVVDISTRVHRPRPSLAALRRATGVATGGLMPEALTWDSASTLARVRDEHVDVVVCVTGRAYDSALAGAAPVCVLDFLDRLSASYRDRAALSPSLPRRVAMRSLSATSRRFERRAMRGADVRIAAGWTEAPALGAQWVPIVLPATDAVTPATDRSDVVFFGNLAYAPNRGALQRLARIWPAVQARRPGTTALIGGANASLDVMQLAARFGWRLQPDYPDSDWMCARGRVFLCPIDHATGMQNKVLEAAMAGLPMVLTPTVAAGFDPELPARVSADDGALVTALVDLLDVPEEATALGRAARAHMLDLYTPGRWAPWAAEVLSTARRRRGTPAALRIA